MAAPFKSFKPGLVSVGLATRNRAPLLPAAIEVILSQTYRNLELIISDNASTDETQSVCEAYAKKDSRVRYIRQKQDIGSFANCNATIREARGEFFMRADDDDFHGPTVIEHAVAALQAHPDAVLAFGDFSMFDPLLGTRTDHHAADYFPFHAGRYGRVKQFLLFHLSKGKGLLLFGLWRKRFLGNGIGRSYYFGWDENILLENLIEGPFVHIPEIFFVKGARIEPASYSPPGRIIRSLFHRVEKLFAPFFYVNMGIILRSPRFTLSEKIRLVAYQFFVMVRLFFVRGT